MPLSVRLQQGSALLVVLALIVMLSVMTTLGLGMFKTETPVDRSIETRAKMERIANQLSSYTQNHFRVPCPAKGPETTGFDPGLFNTGREDATGEKCNTPYHGIVPYRTLNLSYEDILDAWGQPIAYAVSPVFAMTQPLASSQAAGYCRTNGLAYGATSSGRWIVNPYNPGDGTGAKNINPRKAMFCCPANLLAETSVATDLRIVRPGSSFSSGIPIDPSPYSPGNNIRTTIAADFGALDTPAAALLDPNDYSPETWAFVLLSYGANGRTDASLRENENADSNSAAIDQARTFIDAPRNLSSSDKYFDDVLFYMTQDQAMARLNNGSCRTPYFSYQHNF